ncbi:hypothetical protein MMA231_00974 [Asticcacaulis sp. MM231]|uniref:phage protein Gp37 n=1 Tax=Asticcacaulis sp. MM231 TaxID=3157666 RepID=UPI0032D59087
MIGAIENGILDLLKNAGGVALLGYDYQTLESFPDDWETYLGANSTKIIKSPGAWVTFGGWRKLEQTNSRLQVEGTFGLVVAAKNLRNQREQRHGGTAGEVGSFQLVEDAAKLLLGQTLGLDIEGFDIGACQYAQLGELLRKKGLNMLALQLTTKWWVDRTYFNPADDIGDFETFAGDWDLPPVTGVDLRTQTTLPT